MNIKIQTLQTTHQVQAWIKALVALGCYHKEKQLVDKLKNRYNELLIVETKLGEIK